MNERLFGYIRVSSQGQVDKDGPKRQMEALRDFSNKNLVEIIHVFSEAVSGTVDGLDRPKFAEMLGLAKEREITGIVVEKLDRLARDLIVSEMLIREIRARGLKLFAADQGPVDQVTSETEPGRKFIRQVVSAMAEYEKSALVLKLRAARERIRRETGRCDGRKPYGKNRAEQAMIEAIGHLRSSEISWRGIAEMFIRDGVKKRNGSTKWDGKTLHKIYHASLRAKEVRGGNSATDARASVSAGSPVC